MWCWTVVWENIIVFLPQCWGKVFSNPLLSLRLLFSCSVMSDSYATPWTIVCQAPIFMGFPRQVYWSGRPFPSPGDLPDPGMEPMSPALAGRFFTTEPRGKPKYEVTHMYFCTYPLSVWWSFLLLACWKLYNCYFKSCMDIKFYNFFHIYYKYYVFLC